MVNSPATTGSGRLCVISARVGRHPAVRSPGAIRRSPNRHSTSPPALRPEAPLHELRWHDVDSHQCRTAYCAAFLPVTCADVPEVGRRQTGLRGSHAGTFGHRDIGARSMASPGATRPGGVPIGRRVPLLHETLATRIGRKAWSCSGNWLAATDESRQWSGSRSGLLAGSACPMTVGVYPFRALGRWVG
jgi:hypothetical protein